LETAQTCERIGMRGLANLKLPLKTTIAHAEGSIQCSFTYVALTR
jgi:hypothetical protein